MNKEQLYRIALAFTLTTVGMFVFTLFFSEASFFDSIALLYTEKKLGALISIGALPNLAAFFLLLRKDKYTMAYGMVGFLLLLVCLVAGLKLL